jgi:hypothetical protein
MLLRQWIDETKKHAPSLTYIVYEGYADMMADWFDRDLSRRLLASVKGSRPQKNQKRWL